MTSLPEDIASQNRQSSPSAATSFKSIEPLLDLLFETEESDELLGKAEPQPHKAITTQSSPVGRERKNEKHARGSTELRYQPRPSKAEEVWEQQDPAVETAAREDSSSQRLLRHVRHKPLESPQATRTPKRTEPVLTDVPSMRKPHRASVAALTVGQRFEPIPINSEFQTKAQRLDREQSLNSDRGMRSSTSTECITPQAIKFDSRERSNPGVERQGTDDLLLPTNQKNDSSESIEEQLLTEAQQVVQQEDPQVADLADSVNTLIPLIVELLNYKINDSRESILKAVTPVIDRIIEQRSTEDAIKMAEAIAKILPNAITRKIQLSPQAIAKAVAPEIALAIEEQIRLDRNAISHALGSEMGKAIKTQIELEKDAMVDALYPVIGSTISKYMVEVVREINAKVESAFSPEGIKRKIRARLRGVSEAELILQEAVNYHVQAVFLIDKNSGLIIQEVQSDRGRHLESDLVAGMLTAIRSFAADCIASGSELDAIDYGDWQIPIEAAGYYYLAVVIQGEPSKQFRNRIRNTLSQIILEYGDSIQNYDGNPDTVPPSIEPLLEQLVETDVKTAKSQSQSFPTAILCLLGIISGTIFIPWGIVHYRHTVASNIKQQTAIELDAAPELSVYRLEPQVSQEKLILTGRVPSEYLRLQAAEIGQNIAKEHDLELENQIIAVDVPLNPSLLSGEIKRLTTTFNQQDDIAISSSYQANTVTIDGFILEERDLESVSRAFNRIPGVDNVVVTAATQLPTIDQRIYFELNSTELKSAVNSSKIKAIEQFLNQYPQLHLRLIGHSDRQGSRSRNQQLSLERASNVRSALVSLGIDGVRLKIHTSDLPPANVTDDLPLWLSRCVIFEPFIPPNSN